MSNKLERKKKRFVNENTMVEPIILIDKPLGITSMDVIRILRKKLLISKIGHAGTLDPLASGLMVVGVTKVGTKQLGELTNQDKVYVTEIDLLKSSETGDMEKFVQEVSLDDKKKMEKINIPDLQDIAKLLENKFVGTITQIPPIYSALLIDGKRAYELAREGKNPEIKPRNIIIHELNILEYQFPILKLYVKCSKGTYIRTLGQDIGMELNLWGTLKSLRRINSGKYSIENAHNLDTITIDDILIN